jgi:MFS family permease
MVSENPEKAITDTEFSMIKTFWSLYLLGGFQSLAYSGFIILVVPLSFLIWPNDSYHALEMGIILTSLFWLSSVGGLIFGFLIDKFSRRSIIFIISLLRGFSMAMLGFAIEGQGRQTWIYFLFFIIIFAFFAGGSWPSILSLSNDIVPKTYRSRFFGVLGIMMGLFTTFGFLIASVFVQYGFWRQYFWGVGFFIVFAGFVFFTQIKEPKRGSQEKELYHILKDDSIEYDFQINKETMRKTMLSRTNLIALIEGISTNILMGSIVILVLPYIQTPPHNLSPVFTGVFMIIFGLTGGLIGQLSLAKLSDRYAAQHPIRRVYFIVLSLIVGSTTFALLFFIPLPHLTIEQGKDIPFLLSLPMVWLMGIMFFISSIITSLFLVNQAPLLQEINLPEAQGKITSWNQLVENIGWGIGPLLVGIMLTISNNNYQYTVLLLILCILPGVSLWFIVLKTFGKDREEIRKIIEERAGILKNRKNSLIQ